MKYSISLKTPLIVLFSLLLLASCEDPIDATAQWRINNEGSFKGYISKEDHRKASISGPSAYVYTKWLTHGEGKKYPIETSRIKRRYEMHMLVRSKVMDGDYGSGRSVESTINHGPKKQLTGGARIGLQRMVIGNKAEVIIPWYLAYGERRTEEVGPYSALKSHVKFGETILETQHAAEAHE